MNGQFVISLDYEKHWGVFDCKSIDDYKENLENSDVVVDRLLELCNKYNVKLTFSTVGLLFNKDREEFIKNTPKLLPTYANTHFNPYSSENNLWKNNTDSKYYSAYDTIIKIKNDGKHEIGTHTYCHYYCIEEGQTEAQFDADIKMAKKIAGDLGIEVKSIVFPRNQVNHNYFDICKANGILSYRGNEDHLLYKQRPEIENKKTIHRGLRLLDSYINITGSHIYDLNELKSNTLINIPSSNFFRPYSKRISFFESYKVKRAQSAMKKAAKQNKLFHLWFHPHNFGKNINENFKNLEAIFKTYSVLNKEYNFTSSTMTELAKKLSTPV